MAGLEEKSTWLISRPNWIVSTLRRTGHVQVGNEIDTVLLGLKDRKRGKAGNESLVQFIGFLCRAAWINSKSARASKWDGMGWMQLYGRLMYI